MSHFTVLVCLDKSVDLSRDEKGDRVALNFALDNVLNRFDESKEVEPYREYVDGGPADFWWVGYARDKRDAVLDAQLIKDEADEKLADSITWKRWADQLDRYEKEFDGLRWLDIIKLYDAWKRESGDRSADIFYDDESDRAYELSTYNPQSRWDWWTIGGRWAGKFHRGVDAPDDDVLTARGGEWNSPQHERWEGRVNGGRVRYVDLERARRDAEAQAVKHHREYHALRAEWGEGYVPWSTFVGRVDAEEITIDEARTLYRDQPFRQALNASETFKWWWGDVDAEFGVSEKEYAEIARRGAVTCYSMVTKAGVWMEPGQMGWFGTSSDTDQSREAYDVEANTYLASLDPDDIIVVVDAHI